MMRPVAGVAVLLAAACGDEFPTGAGRPLDDSFAEIVSHTMMVGHVDSMMLELPGDPTGGALPDSNTTQVLTGVQFRFESMDTTAVIVESFSTLPGDVTPADSLNSGRTAVLHARKAGFAVVLVRLPRSLGPPDDFPVLQIHITVEERWGSVAAGNGYACGVTKNGNEIFSDEEVRPGSRGYCWGTGPLGAGVISTSAVPVAIIGDHRFREISADGLHTCARDLNSLVFCWGDNRWGQLGTGLIYPASTVPQPLVVGTPAQALSTGGHFSCARLGVDDGLDEVHCWGNGGNGNRGDGTQDVAQPFPVALVPVTLGLADVSAGGYHACARYVTGGGVDCWGGNDYGQVGVASPMIVTSPSTVNLIPLGVTAVLEVSAGGRHTCALTDPGGDVWCWGRNLEGQLGNGDPTGATSASPVLVSDAGAFDAVPKLAVETGFFFSCALTAHGDVFCWGSESFVNSPITRAPVQVPGGVRFESISAYGNQICGVEGEVPAVVDPTGRNGTGGAIYCWRFGSTPVRIPEPDWDAGH